MQTQSRRSSSAQASRKAKRGSAQQRRLRRPVAKGSVVLLQVALTPGGRLAWEVLPASMVPMSPPGWGEVLGKIGQSILAHQKHEQPLAAAEQMLGGFVRGLQAQAPHIPSGSA